MEDVIISRQNVSLNSLIDDLMIGDIVEANGKQYVKHADGKLHRYGLFEDVLKEVWWLAKKLAFFDKEDGFTTEEFQEIFGEDMGVKGVFSLDVNDALQMYSNYELKTTKPGEIIYENNN